MSQTQAARPISEVVSKPPVQPVPDQPERVLTTAELLADIKVLFDEMDAAGAYAEQKEIEAIEAEYAYEIAWSTARIQVEDEDGSVEYKKARAVHSSAEKKRALGIANVVARAAKRADEKVDRKLSGLQTLSNHAREEMRMGYLRPEGSA